MKKTLLSILALTSSTAFLAQCSEVFISEFVDGWSNNRALEIYNPTDNPIDLSAYSIKRYSNGSTSASADYTLTLSGTVQPKDVYVYVKDSTAGDYVWDSLYVKADAYLGPDYNINRTFFWNGNDAVVLFKGSTPIDAIGTPGEDPEVLNNASGSSDPKFGWPIGASIAWTKDHTLVRKSTVTSGSLATLPPTSTSFVPATEWDSLPANTFDNLGTHACDCNPVSIDENTAANFNLFPNPTDNRGTSIIGKSNIASIRVFNLLGTQVFSDKVGGINVYSLSTESFDKGVYLISVQFENGSVGTKKLSVK